MRRLLSLMMAVSLLAPLGLTVGCASNSSTQNVNMAPMSELPPEMQSAPATVREAYQFAAANPAPLQNVPCYCGCAAIGHTSNYSCFIKNGDSGGKIVFETHALECSLCVDIAQEVLKLTKEGKSPGDIRTQVVADFSRFGPPNQ